VDAAEESPQPRDIVAAGNAGRQEHLVPLRMGRMAPSPFAFLRGAAAVMAWDLSHTPVTGMQVLIDGDAHINNFGLYGTPQRDVVVDLNDFDEATVGPWEWDLKRLVASVNVAGRENGFNLKERNRAVRKTVSGYRLNMARLAAMGILEVSSLFGYAERRPTIVKVPNQAWADHSKDGEKGKTDDERVSVAEDCSPPQRRGWRFQDDPPILTRVDEATRSKVVASLVEYAEHLSPAYRIMLRRYAVADVAHRVVGVGSVGTRAYLTLCFGNGDTDPLFLQVKEAIVPVHAAYLPPTKFVKSTITRSTCHRSSAAAAGARRPAVGRHHDRRAPVLRAPNEEHEGLHARVIDDRRTVRLLGVYVRGLLARAHARGAMRSAWRATVATETRWIARWRNSQRRMGTRPSVIMPSW
jgi:uncharacterized protein (DUF2252 family)